MIKWKSEFKTFPEPSILVKNFSLSRLLTMILNEFIDEDSHQLLELHYNLIKVEKRLRDDQKSIFSVLRLLSSANT